MRKPANAEGAAPELERARVAEVIVTHAGGRRRGSGYRTAAGAVLTAAHVVDAATAVELRFEPDVVGREWSAPALDWWIVPGSDLAVVEMAPRAGEEPVRPCRFGRIGDRAAVLAVQAVGFPRWKLRNDDGTVPAPGDGRSRYRDAHHIAGSVAVLSNFRAGSLEVVVPAAPADRDACVSVWEGMSGAALWAGDRIVGVVAEHHPGDGLARLAAARLDRCLDRLEAADQQRLATLLALEPEQVPDVLPASPHDRTRAAAAAQVASIAPEQLLGRDAELAELVRFCAGEQPYLWWQAGPWAGKSALMAWFALHPPGGVDVVSFFVLGRLAGQSDSDAFLDAMLGQLAALGHEPEQGLLEGRNRISHWQRLLAVAGARCAEVGRRLLVVVDGLDEDTGPGTGLPSIASLLPARPPPQVRVVVAARPYPALPHDVAADHPLRDLAPRLLSASPHARAVERAATAELTRILHGPPLPRDVLGLVTAAGGGLAAAELAELLGRSPFEIEALLAGPVGRTVAARASPVAVLDRPADPVYLLTHDTLRETAERRFGPGLSGYRDRILGWADHYRRLGWPEETPTYHLDGHHRLLLRLGRDRDLLKRAMDEELRDRMLAVTRSDGQALAELTVTTRHFVEHRAPDLGTLLELALVQDRFIERDGALGPNLAVVWVRIGHPRRALAMAAGMADPQSRARALMAVVAAAVEEGDRAVAAGLADAAAAHARELTDPTWRSWALGAWCRRGSGWATGSAPATCWPRPSEWPGRARPRPLTGTSRRWSRRRSRRAPTPTPSG